MARGGLWERVWGLMAEAPEEEVEPWEWEWEWDEVVEGVDGLGEAGRDEGTGMCW